MNRAEGKPFVWNSAVAGRVCVVVAAVLWSTNGFFAKSPFFVDWPPETRGLALAFWRAAFAGLFILPVVRRPRWNARLVPMAVCFALMNVTFLQSMVLTTAANAIWLQSTAPFWVLVLNATIWHEPLDRRDLAPLAFAMLGIGLILACELQAKTLFEAQGVIYGLVSGVLYAVVVSSIRSLRGEDSAFLVAVNLLTTALLLLPLVLVWGPTPSASQLGVLFCFGSLQLGLPYLLFARGLRNVSSHEGAILALVEPVLVPVWTYLAWREKVAWWTLAGGACILFGLALRYGRPTRRASAEPSTQPGDIAKTRNDECRMTNVESMTTDE